VRDVEEPGALSHGRVLREDRLVLHGQLEAREGHHAPAEPHVRLVEGGALERLVLRDLGSFSAAVPRLGDPLS
jgi:hypothetical protein